MSVRILHFADAHIDSYSGGKIDPANGLPYHTNDFMKSLDEIVNTAISEKVDLVLFAGDAYRSPVPAPTFQREWQRRVKRLSEAHIPLLMIPGNHDVSPSSLKASSLQELDTLPVPYVHLAEKQIHLWKPEELDGVPVQVIAVPWMSFSVLTVHEELAALNPEERAMKMEQEITDRVKGLLAKADPDLPVILLAHYSVQGCTYPSGQTAQLGREVTLSRALVCDPAISYTALGHIHLFQDLNEGQQPPAVYSGSIERVDYGEAKEKKGFILADVAPGHTDYVFRELHTRRMYNLKCEISDGESMQQTLLELLPDKKHAEDAMIRLEFSYPHEFESFYNERELRKKAEGALDFQLKRQPTYASRIRIQNKNVSSLTPGDLLKEYCLAARISDNEAEELGRLAEEIFSDPTVSRSGN